MERYSEEDYSEYLRLLAKRPLDKFESVVEGVCVKKDQWKNYWIIVSRTDKYDIAVKAVGKVKDIFPKDKVSICGVWEKHEKFGWQFRIKSIQKLE